MSKFEIAVQGVLKNEGGYSHNDHDMGGATNHGISLRFYKKNIKVDATAEDIKNLTLNQAADIYEKYFWDRNRYAEINNQQTANKMLDLAVNVGPATANAFIQNAVNNTNNKEHLKVDGQIGIITLKAINAVYDAVLYGSLINEAHHYYHEIAKRGNNHIFLRGWLSRLHSL